jgi:DNA-binding response OmpR family regulator
MNSRRLRVRVAIARLPIIMLTARGEEGERMCAAAGAM